MNTDCPFCDVARDRVWLANAEAVAFPDSYPVSHGHVLVIPLRHVGRLDELSTAEQAAVWELAAQVRQRLQEQHRPDGFNIGINDGAAAGQTIGHAHVHVIPRYHGDVPDARGGIRWVIPSKAAYWSMPT